MQGQTQVLLHVWDAVQKRGHYRIHCHYQLTSSVARRAISWIKASVISNCPVSTSISIEPISPKSPVGGSDSHTGTRQRIRSLTTSVGSPPCIWVLISSATNPVTFRRATK